MKYFSKKFHRKWWHNFMLVRLTAYKKRGVMRKQIHQIDREFSEDLPDIKVIH